MSYQQKHFNVGRLKKIFFFFFNLILISCSEVNNNYIPIDNNKINNDLIGRGKYVFNYSTSKSSIQTNIYFYVPENISISADIIFIFHGNARNAIDYRNALIEKADSLNFIILAPEFSEKNFPGGDGYNLGNVFVDGDNPSEESLNPEIDWTFSLVEPIFESFLELSGVKSTSYNIIGHSAGGQFAHRLMFFKPYGRYNKIITSAPGWYTCVDFDVSFPYGFLKSPLEKINLKNTFDVDLTIQVGSLDNNPNDNNLRHNSIVDIQGLNRLERAYYFFGQANSLSSQLNHNFNWNLIINDGATHDYRQALDNAVKLIYE